MITLQRSVTFPPIRLRRIDEYIHYVAKNAPTLEELRERGLEIGRGRGDITRLLERIQVVEVNNNRVSLTSAGRQLVSLREALSLSVYHALFFQRLFHYKLLVGTLAELREGDFENLHGAVNERLSRISPTAWLNKVAFKTLLQIAEDVGAVEKRNGIYYYRGDPVEKAVSEYYEKHGVKIGSNYYVAVDKVLVEECAKEEKPHNLYKVDTGCTVTKIYNFFVI